MWNQTGQVPELRLFHMEANWGITGSKPNCMIFASFIMYSWINDQVLSQNKTRIMLAWKIFTGYMIKWPEQLSIKNLLGT